MKRQLVRLGLGLVASAFGSAPAFAHHVMGGRTPATFGEGILSGLGHPVIGLDHLAAVVAVGCLAAAHRSASVLAVVFVLAMTGGVALHLHGTAVPGAEILVALTVLVLGVLLVVRGNMSAGVAAVLFAMVGVIHGYSLGESIYGAERTPLYAYLTGLAVIQGVIALAAAHVTRSLLLGSPDLSAVRLVGAGIAGIGLAILMQQVMPGA
ncbi:MAG TPA: HupE/UreJ family protein [Pseudolabrys sp.]|nr:HupE/UreJ family protein [Pseudolabrys sp.]